MKKWEGRELSSAKQPLQAEAKHYSHLRNLVKLKQYSEALQKGWQLYASLCKSCRMVRQHESEAAGSPVLPAPAGTCATREGATLVTGTVLTLLLCTAEAVEVQELEGSLLQLLDIAARLTPWLRSARHLWPLHQSTVH